MGTSAVTTGSANKLFKNTHPWCMLAGQWAKSSRAQCLANTWCVFARAQGGALPSWRTDLPKKTCFKACRSESRPIVVGSSTCHLFSFPPGFIAAAILSEVADMGGGHERSGGYGYVLSGHGRNGGRE